MNSNKNDNYYYWFFTRENYLAISWNHFVLKERQNTKTKQNKSNIKSPRKHEIKLNKNTFFKKSIKQNKK